MKDGYILVDDELITINPAARQVQVKRLVILNDRLRAIASKVGPMHSFWDMIFDIDCFLAGKNTILQNDINGWILEAEKYLGA